MKCKEDVEFGVQCQTRRSVSLYDGSIEWSKYFGSIAVLGFYVYEIMCARSGWRRLLGKRTDVQKYKLILNNSDNDYPDEQFF
jgi:hypothetical protein